MLEAAEKKAAGKRESSGMNNVHPAAAIVRMRARFKG
jgi:hypothetical protein